MRFLFEHIADSDADVCLRTGSGCRRLIEWIEYADSQVVGGRKNATAHSVAECQAACELNASCTGVDWDPVNGVGDRCWLHGRWSGERRIGGVIGMTHYDINRTDTCPSMSTLLLVYRLAVRLSVSG